MQKLEKEHKSLSKSLNVDSTVMTRNQPRINVIKEPSAQTETQECYETELVRLRECIVTLEGLIARQNNYRALYLQEKDKATTFYNSLKRKEAECSNEGLTETISKLQGEISQLTEQQREDGVHSDDWAQELEAMYIEANDQLESRNGEITLLKQQLANSREINRQQLSDIVGGAVQKAQEQYRQIDVAVHRCEMGVLDRMKERMRLMEHRYIQSASSFKEVEAHSKNTQTNCELCPLQIRNTDLGVMRNSLSSQNEEGLRELQLKMVDYETIEGGLRDALETLGQREWLVAQLKKECAVVRTEDEHLLQRTRELETQLVTLNRKYEKAVVEKKDMEGDLLSLQAQNQELNSKIEQLSK